MIETENHAPEESIKKRQAEPRLEYTNRREARLTEAARLMRRFRVIGIFRLGALALSFVTGWLVYQGSIAWWWLFASMAMFIALAEAQRRLTQSKRRCERAAALYERGLERLDDRWAGRGATGARFLDGSHPYAEDLDLFGRGSLFELLSRSVTRTGEDTLAEWLLAPAAPEAVRARQTAVTELRPRLDFREELALLSEDIHTGQEAQALAAWATAPAWHISLLVRVTAIGLALLTIITLVLWFAGFGGIPFLVLFIVGRVFDSRWRTQVQQTIGGVDGAGRELALLSGVLGRLERERFSSPRLAELRAALDVEGLSPSRQIARLNRLIEMLDARRNMIFAPFAVLLLWPVQFAILIERWRQTSGPAVARWLAAVGEIEALNSLASYSFEHPEFPFPELTEGAACFEGEGLGHPLIPESRVVRTDLYLASERQGVLIISGSNMSGKSTLLRAVGTNAVLALAGAPVSARKLRLSALEVGASIRVQDSLQAGASRFYAEITRLRQIVGLTEGPRPVLFLLDEILHGTNSHDRRIGAEGVVRGLMGRGAIGLITTHDLALTEIVVDLAPRAGNVHFEDHLEEGKMVFDYLLRPGVVKKSNALELMRSIGLEV